MSETWETLANEKQLKLWVKKKLSYKMINTQDTETCGASIFKMAVQKVWIIFTWWNPERITFRKHLPS